MDKNVIKKRHESTINLPDSLQVAFIDFIHEKVGMVIKPGHHGLIRLINDKCEQYQYSPIDYLESLRKADENSEILSQLVSTITIGETYFFRDKRQIDLLREYILPQIIQHKIKLGEESLRIWSAGCSSGEEIYTVVMLVKDLLPNMNDWKCCFHATDINIELLRKGMLGNYGEWSMRSIPENYLNKYFKKTDTHYQLDEDIRKRVTFDYLNLNSNTYPSILNGTLIQDLVICRNVLIYFNNEHIKSILDKLGRCIVEHGYLLLGASDPIGFISNNFTSVAKHPSLFIRQTTQAVTKKEVLKLADTELKPVVMPPDEIRELTKKPEAPAKSFSDDSVDMLCAEALALANIGKIKEAIKACEEAIKRNSMHKAAYFIYALSLAENKEYDKAEAAYRKSLYLDPDFLMCRYQFALFLIRIDRLPEGIKALKSIIKVAAQHDEDAIVPDSQSISYKQLITILEGELKLYSM